MFSELAVAYLFFGGAGAGACVVLGVLECANIGRYGALPSGSGAGVVRTRSSRWSRRLRAPHELLARGWVLCLLLLGTGSLCLLADAGRPERVVALWLAPRFSAVTVGAWALLASSVAATFFAVASNGPGARLHPALVLAAAVAAIVAGLVTAVYTGVLLGSLPSVLAYRTGVLPVLFLLSSLSCGAAVVFAAVTSLLNLFEAPVEALQAQLGLSRAVSVGIVAVLAVAVGLFLENGSSVSDWMDVISIYVIPVGAFLAAVMFFWVCPRGFAKKQAEMGRKKPIGRWFDFMTRYVFVIITALVIVLGIFYGGIG